MYGENGAQMRTELAALLRQHRVMHRLGADSLAERAEVGQQIRRFRQTILVWCSQAVGAARPLTFANVPAKPGDPFRAASDHGAAVRELSRALDLARGESADGPAPSVELTTASSNEVVEHWRLAARAAVLAEHDTAPDRTIHLTAAQGRAIVGDVAAISQALVVLDRRYRNTPEWEPLAQCDRLGWAALATALDVSLGQPDYSVDQTGWRPRTKPIRGPAKPGVLGVLQAEHNLVVAMGPFPTAVNLRYVVDSQRRISQQLVPFAARIDQRLADRWVTRADTFTRLQRQLRAIGGRAGRGDRAASEGATAVSRLRGLPADMVVEPRVLGGFQVLFDRLDRRIAEVIEDGIDRRVYFQRVTLPRIVEGTGELTAPVRERYLPLDRTANLELIETIRCDLMPRSAETSVTPGPSRADLHAALIHRSSAGRTRAAPTI